MTTEALNDANAAYKTTIAARRQSVKNLGIANNSHNRAELLQVTQTLEVLREIIRDENGRQD